jgi:hypothetical protein
MKTINKDIEIFNSLAKAEIYFDKCQAPCHLLKHGNDYFVDKSKTALENWPKLYTLIKEK